MRIKCFKCDQPFENYTILAQHIVGSKKGHRRSKKWAAKYLLINKLSTNAKRKQPNRTPLTADEKSNKTSAFFELSGRSETKLTMCPQCKKGYEQLIPVEYISSPVAWRAGNGTLMKLCPKCQTTYTKRATYTYAGSG